MLDQLLALDRVLMDPGRLAILAVLLDQNSAAGFVELKEACAMTDGNLNRHLHHLAKHGIVQVSKHPGQRPRTMVELSPQGRKALGQHLDHVQSVTQAMREALNKPRASQPSSSQTASPEPAQPTESTSNAWGLRVEDL